MEARGQEGEIGVANLHLAPLFPTPPPDKRRNSTLPTETLDPAPLPDPSTSSADRNNHSPPPPSTDHSVRYRECQKNHAVSIGGHVLDGCGEFMPSGDDGTPQALRCAACNCHRNFHRKVVDGQTPPPPSHSYAYNPNRQTHLNQHQHGYPHGLATGVTMVSFGGGAAAESSSEDLHTLRSGAAAASASYSGRKKRFRTKFSRDQKDRMHEFARKLGWRMQNQDEQQVLDFCRQVGIKREVFKVWMHNNKQAIKKAASSQI